jgi:hypothetical protein
MQNHFAVVENGSNFVLGVQSTNCDLIEPEPGTTARPVSQGIIDAFNAWLSDRELTDFVYDPVTDSYGEQQRPEIPAVIDKTAIAADGVDVATISGLPNLSTITVAGIGKYSVTDGTFELTTQTPGIYQVLAEADGYLPKEFVVHAG